MDASLHGRISAGSVKPFPVFSGVSDTRDTVGIASWFMSATAVLPGESRAEFEKLHRGLIDEFAPSGVLEDDIVTTMARLVWRKQNLTTLRIAERAQARREAIVKEKFNINPSFLLTKELDEVDPKELRRDAYSEAQE